MISNHAQSTTLSPLQVPDDRAVRQAQGQRKADRTGEGQTDSPGWRPGPGPEGHGATRGALPRSFQVHAPRLRSSIGGPSSARASARGRPGRANRLARAFARALVIAHAPPAHTCRGRCACRRPFAGAGFGRAGRSAATSASTRDGDSSRGTSPAPRSPASTTGRGSRSTFPTPGTRSTAQDGGNNYRRGPGWYRRHLAWMPPSPGRRLYLQFDGASLMADVYVNGVHLGNHKGGFARFRFDATGALRAGADNVIAVRVDNGQLGIPPTSADFTFFGGLYRDVSLLATDPVQISAMDYGSPGVFLRAGPRDRRLGRGHSSAPSSRTTAPSPGRSTSGVRSIEAPQAGRALANSGLRHSLGSHLEAERLRGGRQARHDQTARTSGTPGPTRTSTRSGSSCQPVSADGSPGALSDAVEQPLGLRSYAVDPDRGFLLNGSYLDLYGFNRHQDWPDKGWAISDAEEAEDFGIMKDSGATAVRVSHYQQSDSWYSRCDRSGIVAWAEIPFVNEALDDPGVPREREAAAARADPAELQPPGDLLLGRRERDERARGRRGDRGAGPGRARGGPDAPVDLRLQPRRRRPEELAHRRRRVQPVLRMVPTGSLSDFAAWLDRTHADYPKARFAMSEFGAGASIFQHAENPARARARGLFPPRGIPEPLPRGLLGAR